MNALLADLKRAFDLEDSPSTDLHVTEDFVQFRWKLGN